MNTVITFLVRGFTVICAYQLSILGTKETKNNLSAYILKGLKWVVGIALVANFFLGTHSENCDDDPIYGRCDTVQDYEPTINDRISNFSLFFGLLSIPVVIGAFIGFKQKNKIEKREIVKNNINK